MNGDQKDSSFVLPGHPSKCTWSLESNAEFGHKLFGAAKPPSSCVVPDILHAIGNTPLVRLNSIPAKEGIKCQMYAKCEFLNPGGSLKDRIGYRMVQEAEESGVLKPGATIIEPSSGNTGIGLALAAAVKGYKCIIVMPWKMSQEKVSALKALGAEIVRTPTEEPYDSPKGLFGVSQRLCREIPNAIILDQYKNPYNPLAHYEGTASEMWKQTNGNIDMVVIGTGTGGTITGIGRFFKEKRKDITIVGVDPYGSVLAQPSELNETDVTTYQVEGIGYDFIPTVLDRSVVDKWIKTSDKESLVMSRRLIREEGLLCGGSSGAVMVGALKAAAHLDENKHVVVVLADGIRNYLTKMVDDAWMKDKGFYD